MENQDTHRRKAFIAAPLIGTILFVTAVLYSVNLTKTESMAAAQISDDTYHNRVTSLLSLYKSDLMGLFTDGLRQNIEDFFTSAGWIGINDVENFTSTDRYQKCTANVAEIHNQLILSGVSGNMHLNGLSDLLNATRRTYQFEGILFEPVKFDPFPPSFDPSKQVTWDFTCKGEPGYTLCSNLLPTASFDCSNYATNLANPYQCCSKQLALGERCPAEDIIKGCENGNFYMTMNLSDVDVYKAMPRVEAVDTRGNVIRADVMGQASFLLPIRFPLFKYNDASFRIFSYGQYFDHINEIPPIANRSPVTAQDPQKPATLDKNQFINAVGKACSFLSQNPYFHDIGFNITINKYNPTPSQSVTEECKVGSINLNDLRTVMNSGVFPNTLYTGSVNIVLIDNDPRFRVNPSKPNTLSVDHHYEYG